jgi:hypothetical protein
LAERSQSEGLYEITRREIKWLGVAAGESERDSLQAFMEQSADESGGWFGDR